LSIFISVGLLAGSIYHKWITLIKGNKEGRAFVFEIRYYVSNNKEGLPNSKEEIDMPDNKTVYCVGYSQYLEDVKRQD